MAIYEFKEEDAIRFSRERGIRTHISGSELVFSSCPYCHGGPKRDKNTFAINLKTGLFNCKRSTCGEKGGMVRLHDDFDFSLGRDADAYFARKRNRRAFQTYYPTIRTAAVQYMASRGISQATTESYHITTQEKDDSILVFPFYYDDGTMHFIKYRNTAHQKGDSGSKEWCQPNMEPILFGMDHCDPSVSDTLVMTEGQIDSLSVTEVGIPNAVSVPTGALGFTWYPNCVDFLRQYRTLIIFGDYEHEEITLLKEMQRRFNHGRLMHVRPEDYKGCKDANEILQKYGADAVREAVNNAVPVISKRTIAMCDVRPEDDEAAEKLHSGIDGLDRLTGGFRYGHLVILTGERGLGKSTLGSQFVAEAVNHGIVSYIYSGEMRNCDVQNWIDRQFVGPRFIKERTSKSGYKFYILDKDKEERVWQWYAKYLYMFNNEFDAGDEDGEDEQVSVLNELQDAIVNLGARVLLVDNLMIALDDDLEAELNREQTRFVNRLSRLAKKYDVLVFLVAHPRKGTNAEKSSNDDVSGSGHITDLANLVIKYTKPPDKFPTECDRVLIVMKNRINGLTNYEGIPLYFDAASKRIVGKSGDFDYHYSWENEDDQWEESKGDGDVPKKFVKPKKEEPLPDVLPF